MYHNMVALSPMFVAGQFICFEDQTAVKTAHIESGQRQTGPRSSGIRTTATAMPLPDL